MVPPGEVPVVWQARRPSSRQPAQRSTSDMYVELPTLTLAPLTRASGRSSLRSFAGEPKYWPSAVTRGGPEPPLVPSEKIEVRASGASGAKACHAARASLACDHGKEAKNQEAPRVRCVCRARLVTIPKLPPPPPRQAQKRSSLLSAVTWRTRPSAVTI